MLDTRGSGIEYTREQLADFEKVSDLFINDKREIYAELLRDGEGRTVYFREWFTSNGGEDNFNFGVINSLDELKIELKKDVDHGDLAPGLVNKICTKLQNVWGN
ncbi:MAG: hypothetical protein MJ093_06015 [Saccharofermentans sp.]|nr:hypothetical protein [Saccharofermentans sp.]